MSPPLQFRLRWKGNITGPFPLARIHEMLRSGEVSLLHSIEVNEGWMTVRDYFRSIGLNRPTLSSAHPADELYNPNAGQSNPSGHGGNFPNPPGGSFASTQNPAEILERHVREGYLWCGSTFLLPPLFALLVLLWILIVPETAPISRFVLFTFATMVGSFLPIVFVRRTGVILEQEGLGEICQAQSRLVVILAVLGLFLWEIAFWFLYHPTP